MISPISNKNLNINNKPSFKGPLNFITSGLELCNRHPMVGVSFIDATTGIAPRTVIDARTNGFAAAETCRRESMGLIVNCLMPSFVVLGLAKVFQPFIMGKFKNVDMASSWANEETLDKLTDIYKKTNGSTENRIREFSKNVIENLEGFDGNAKSGWKAFAGNVGKASDDLADIILNTDMSKKETKKAISSLFDGIADKTKATQIIRFANDKKAFSSNLSEILRDTVDLGRKFTNKTVSDNLSDFVKRSKSLINKKSAIGMAIMIPLAMSVQFINRAITKLHSGHDGAPIYKDFGKQNSVKLEKDKNNLGLNKLIASAVMIGTTLLTNKNGFSKNMFQFKGLFPTLDQCRWIATATIVSRMMASDDNSELKEASIRDIATFLGLYALGDFVAKGTGSVIEKIKPNVKLINKEKVAKNSKGIIEKVGNWFSKTHLKDFSEVTNAAKPYRSLCQVAHLASSMLVLGLAIPCYVRSCTEKKEAKLKELALAQTAYTEKIKNMKTNNAFASFKAYYKK